ncbi:MAG: carbon-nitrogen hydrolase family protein, partial [Gemmatimonadetes bacterium]|nr:carbon-nitrogen hydrolase family protein [Gemmatimonadota bacterium]
VVNSRACEHRVNDNAVNRVGRERGTNFIGQSKIVDFTGRTLAEGDRSREEIIFADLDLAGAREKHIVNVAKAYELDRLEDRRVEFYGPIVEGEKP